MKITSVISHGLVKGVNCLKSLNLFANYSDSRIQTAHSRIDLFWVVCKTMAHYFLLQNMEQKQRYGWSGYLPTMANLQWQLCQRRIIYALICLHMQLVNDSLQVSRVWKQYTNTALTCFGYVHWSTMVHEYHSMHGINIWYHYSNGTAVGYFLKGWLEWCNEKLYIFQKYVNVNWVHVFSTLFPNTDIRN